MIVHTEIIHGYPRIGSNCRLFPAVEIASQLWQRAQTVVELCQLGIVFKRCGFSMAHAVEEVGHHEIWPGNARGEEVARAGLPQSAGIDGEELADHCDEVLVEAVGLGLENWWL